MKPECGHQTTLLALAWLLNLLAATAITVLLGATWLASAAAADPWAVSALTLFLVFFVLLTAGGVWLNRSRGSFCPLAAAVAFEVGQLLSLLVAALSLIADGEDTITVTPARPFSEDPMAWLKAHHWLPLLFTAASLPVFAVEILATSRMGAVAYAPPSDADADAPSATVMAVEDGTSLRIGGETMRKMTPYHSNTVYIARDEK